MRKCIVVVHPKMSCASLFQKLNKNSKGLDLNLEKNISKVNQFKNYNDIKIITLK